MQLALAVQTPDVTRPLPVALLSGTWSEKLDKAARLGVDGLELMTADPAQLDAPALRAGIEAHGLTAAASAAARRLCRPDLTCYMPSPMSLPALSCACTS